ncbi:solute carrier family 22 member 16-like [Ylistrum balloti]|uniref:solute carrier family 22 member 16-like n=1 Tax=Ylistrum balloti TaxID=509963 RepID=UPI002905AB85|nr:solute carrier family 22 member 16-like [Ylistrum balloti]
MYVDVDDIQRELKPWGRYQVLQLLYLFVSYLPVAIPLFIVIFIGYTPPHKCAELSKPLQEYRLGIPGGNDSDYVINYGQCELTISSNQSNSSWTPVTTSCLQGYSYETTKEYSFVSEWDLVCDKQGLGGLTTTLIMVGQALGATIFTTLSDRYGRKTVFLVTFIPLTAVLTGTAFSPNLLVFNILRIITGFIQQGLGLSMYALCIEMFPLENRGAIAAVAGLYWAIAALFFAGYAFVLRNFSWRILQLACAALAFHCVFAHWIADESLRWLIANNKRRQAMKMIKNIAKRNKLDPYKALCMLDGGGDLKTLSVTDPGETSLLQNETEVGHDERNEFHDGSKKERSLFQLEAEVRIGNKQSEHGKNSEFGNGEAPLIYQKEPETTNGHAHNVLDRSNDEVSNEKRAEKYTILDIFKHKLLLRNSLITWYTWFINSLTYYGLYLSSVTLSTDRYINFLINAALEIPAGVVVWLLINRIGRKKTSIIFHSFAGVALILSVVMKLPKDDTGVANICSITFNFLGKFAITASWTTMGLYTPEIYPTNLRNAGLGAASAAARFGGMLSPYADLLARQVFWGPGVIFGVGSLLVTVGMLMLPETNGRELPQTLEELLSWYKGDRNRKLAPNDTETDTVIKENGETIIST